MGLRPALSQATTAWPKERRRGGPGGANLLGDMHAGNDGFAGERCWLGESLAKKPLQMGLYGGVWDLLLVHLACTALMAGLPDDF